MFATASHATPGSKGDWYTSPTSILRRVKFGRRAQLAGQVQEGRLQLLSIADIYVSDTPITCSIWG